MALINLDELDEENEILYTHVWMRYLWRDPYLTWNVSEYDGVTTMRLKLDKIWRPDITIYNRRKYTSVGDVHGVVYNDGSVLHIPPALLATQCHIDLTYFPFDTQICHIKLGSWVFDGYSVGLDFYEGQETMDLSDYERNKKWQIIGNTARINVKYYPCCAEPYPDITYNLTLKRNPSYFTYVYIGPAVILSLLAPFIFLLPAADPQKLTLGSGILFSFSMFFISLGSALPGMHAHTPLIYKYYMAMYVILCIALSMSTLVTNIAKRTITLNHPPNIIKTIIISCLGRCLCVPNDMYSDISNKDDSSGEAGLVKRQESSGSGIKEWLLIATVLDRFFFLVYLILTIALTIIMLNAYPRAEECPFPCM